MQPNDCASIAPRDSRGRFGIRCAACSALFRRSSGSLGRRRKNGAAQRVLMGAARSGFLARLPCERNIMAPRKRRTRLRGKQLHTPTTRITHDPSMSCGYARAATGIATGK